MVSLFLQSSQRSFSQLSDLGFNCDERNSSYYVGDFNMDRIGIFDYSFKRSPVFMGVCGNPSVLQINTIPLLRLEGKIGLENVLFRMKNYYISLRINRTEQRICINPHIHIIYSCGALVRATNFSICCRNSKSDPDFTDIVCKKVSKLEIFDSTFLSMVFHNSHFISLLRKKFDNFCNNFKIFFSKLSSKKINFFTEDMKQMFYDALRNHEGIFVQLLF